MKNLKLLLLAFVAFSTWSAMSYSQVPTESCKKEISEFCPGVAAAALPTCLWSNYSKLHPKCKIKFEGDYNKWPCNVDASIHCKGISDTAERESCLWANYSKLLPACKKLYTVHYNKWPCHVDAGIHCKGITGDADKIKCINEHSSELTAECKKALTKK